MADGQVIFEITGDNKSLLKTLEDTTKSIDEETSKWDNTANSSSNTIKEFFIGAFEAVVASTAFKKIGEMLWNLGVESVGLASDLVEVQNVIDTTFGEEGAKKIESWSKQASKNFGLTEYQAKQYSGYIGAMLQTSGIAQEEAIEMSMKLTEISADLASFYNLDFDTAFNKVYSGMSGMARPLRSLGIDLSVAAIEESAMAEAMGTKYKDMTLAEKYMVRYDEILRQTTLAQGDFAKTSETFANSQKRIETGWATLKTELGEALLPIATQVSNAIAELLEVLTYTPSEDIFTNAADSIAETEAEAAQAQGILGYLDKLYEKYGEAATETDQWTAAMERLKAVFPEVNQFIDEETGKLTMTNEELRNYINNSKEAAIADAKRNVLSGLSEQYVATSQQYYMAEGSRDMAQNMADAAREALIAIVRKYEPGYTGTGVDVSNIAIAARSYANEHYDYETIQTIQNLEAEYNSQMDAVQKSTQEMGELSNDMNRLENELDLASKALDKINLPSQAAADGMNAASSAANGLASALGSLASSPSTNMNSGQYYNWYYGNIGKHADGLNYVPYDNYLSFLHEGEAVLTASEARVWREFINGGARGANAIDYAQLSGAIWDNAPSKGGNVFLDGEIVGRVISAAQGNSYRAMERSGFQQ